MDEHGISEGLGSLLERAVETNLESLENQRPVLPWLLGSGAVGQITTTDGPVQGLFYELGEQGQKVGFKYMVGYHRSEVGAIALDQGYNGVLEVRIYWGFRISGSTAVIDAVAVTDTVADRVLYI